VTSARAGVTVTVPSATSAAEQAKAILRISDSRFGMVYVGLLRMSV